MKQSRIRSIVTSFRSGLLGKRSSEGMCYAVCLPLQCYLKAIGVETAMVKGTVHANEHFWLSTPDFIIDPTADQFGGPKVLVGPKPDHYEEADTFDLVPQPSMAAV
jgi:hypothetical protein